MPSNRELILRWRRECGLPVADLEAMTDEEYDENQRRLEEKSSHESDGLSSGPVYHQTFSRNRR